MTETPAKKPPRSPRRKSALKRRLAMVALGVGLGLLCRLVPAEYQGPCAVGAKLISMLLGAPQ